MLTAIILVWICVVDVAMRTDPEVRDAKPKLRKHMTDSLAAECQTRAIGNLLLYKLQLICSESPRCC